MNPKIKCIVIDDGPVAIDILKDYISQISFLILVDTFRNPLKASEYLQNNKIDLIFLDINMPSLNGIQFLQILPQIPLVIFTTAYSQYAVESYEYNAIDYLVKPIGFDRFVKAANKALDQFNSKDSLGKINSPYSGLKLDEEKNIILFKSGTQLHRIKINDILYIKGERNYSLIVTTTKKIMILHTMKKVMDMLPLKHFYRIHRSFIINFLQVDVIEKDKVFIKNNKLPIGEVYKERFFKAVNKHHTI